MMGFEQVWGDSVKFMRIIFKFSCEIFKKLCIFKLEVMVPVFGDCEINVCSDTIF